MTKRSAYLITALLLAAALLLGGCRVTKIETDTPVVTVPPPPGQEETPQITTAPEETPQSGGTLRLYGVDPHTMDPAISGDATSHQYVLSIFSGLLKLDGDMEPAPDIAAEWKVSNEGRTYTFKLRQDVTFHSGRKVTAADFKYSWERAADPATGSQTAANYLGDIAGIEQVLSGQSREISGVKVIDDYTLEVTIKAPKNYFLSKLTYPTTFVVNRENVSAGREWWHQPDGTGPFRLAGWMQGDSLALERNETYYGRKAYLGGVEFTIFAGVPMSLYETGEIDVTSVSLFNIDRVTDPAGPFHEQFRTAPELSFYYIGFNSQEPPFDDINVRKAFTMAVDKELLARLVFRGSIEPAYGILPPGLPGFNEDLKGLEFDPEQARELIKQSGYGSVSGLPPITFTTLGQGGAISRELEAIIYQWRENLGVEVKVRQLEPLRFLYNLKQEKDNMYDIGWIADYPHPQNFLEVLFGAGSDANYSEYDNPEVNALLEEAGLELDFDRSFELYRQAEQLMIDDAACLPLWFGRDQILVKPYVKGYTPNAVGLVNYSDVWIDTGAE